jgi:hypothetical protein
LISSSVKIGLILPVLGDARQTHGAMLVAAMVSGASERLAPSLIAKLEGRSNETRTGKGKAQ